MTRGPGSLGCTVGKRGGCRSGRTGSPKDDARHRQRRRGWWDLTPRAVEVGRQTRDRVVVGRGQQLLDASGVVGFRSSCSGSSRRAITHHRPGRRGTATAHGLRHLGATRPWRSSTASIGSALGIAAPGGPVGGVDPLGLAWPQAAVRRRILVAFQYRAPASPQIRACFWGGSGPRARSVHHRAVSHTSQTATRPLGRRTPPRGLRGGT